MGFSGEGNLEGNTPIAEMEKDLKEDDVENAMDKLKDNPAISTALKKASNVF